MALFSTLSFLFLHLQEFEDHTSLAGSFLPSASLAGCQHVGPEANCPFKSPPTPAPPSGLWPDFPIRAPPFKVTAPSFWLAVYTNRRAQGFLGAESGHKWAVTGACGSWNHHQGLRRELKLGQGGSWAEAEPLGIGSGLDRAFRGAAVSVCQAPCPTLSVASAELSVFPFYR